MRHPARVFQGHGRLLSKNSSGCKQLNWLTSTEPLCNNRVPPTPRPRPIPGLYLLSCLSLNSLAALCGESRKKGRNGKNKKRGETLLLAPGPAVCPEQTSKELWGRSFPTSRCSTSVPQSGGLHLSSVLTCSHRGRWDVECVMISVRGKWVKGRSASPLSWNYNQDGSKQTTYG